MWSIPRLQQELGRVTVAYGSPCVPSMAQGQLMPYGPVVTVALAVSQWLVIPAQANIPVLPT